MSRASASAAVGVDWVGTSSAGPDLDASLLLRAALAERVSAGRAWDEFLGRHDLGRFHDADLLRLLGRIARNLAGTDHPERARLVGVQRRNWYLAQRTFELAAPVLAALEHERMDHALVGGLAFVRRSKVALTERPVDDTALVVPPRSRQHVLEIARDHGWEPTAPPARPRAAIGSRPLRLSRHDERGPMAITLATSPSPWSPPDRWNRWIASDGALDPAAELVTIVLGGPTRVEPVGRAWIVDVVSLLESAEIQPDRLAEVCDDWLVMTPLTVGFDRLRRALGSAGLDDLLAEHAWLGTWSAGHGDPRADRRARRILATDAAGRWRWTARDWRMATRHLSAGSRLRGAPGFVADRLGTTRPRDLPGTLRRLAKSA